MAQLRAFISTLLPWLHSDAKGASQQSAGEFHEKFKSAYKSGRFDTLIEKAEIDYANGKALHTLY